MLLLVVIPIILSVFNKRRRSKIVITIFVHIENAKNSGF